MSMMKLNEPAEKFKQIAYRLRGLTYVPHYRNKAVFVGLGYPRHTKTRYSAADLLLLGAVPTEEHLWERSSGGEVSDDKP